MTHQTRRWDKVWIACGLVAWMCLLGAGRQLARLLRHIPGDLPGRFATRLSDGGVPLPSVVALEECAQAVAPLILLALLCLLIEEKKPRHRQSGRTVTAGPERSLPVHKDAVRPAFGVWSPA